MLGHLCSRALESFKTRLEQSLARGEGFAASVRSCSQSSMLEFDQGCLDAAIQQASWDASKVREKLHRDIEAHASVVQSEKLSELIANYKKQISAALTEPVESLFESGGKDTWASIRRLLKHETNVAVSAFPSAVAGFELDQAIFEEMVQSLQEYSRSLVERKAREEAGKVLVRMKDTFITVFNHDKNSLPRVWTGKEDIREIAKEARSESLKLLSTMAAVQLDQKANNIENVLFSTLMDRTVTPPQNRGNGVSGDPLASSTWEEVPPEKTLISPVQCKSIWRQFIAETEYTVTQAVIAQRTYEQRNSWLPPPWAIMAMLILGLNEIMFLLRNPLYLLVIFYNIFAWESHMGTDGHSSGSSYWYSFCAYFALDKIPSHSHESYSSVSTETGVEYISPQLKHRIVTNPEQEETSCFGASD
ncbi:unnamed protein product [Fraxinus pennsylvanica]|uniref:Sey1/RHD3-like three-helix bundle domain-containing protein n=1 Tax=Fraxinus pennsylvanica TaxID=56036 RepID=A0AAD1ZK87_9LAMI|nr:unnamed protein product [Fraxinus pennsylvanica]